jgi:hypothetical protein
MSPRAQKSPEIYRLPPAQFACYSANVSDRLDTYLQALRFLARSPEPEENRLMTAELRIREFSLPEALTPGAQRTSLEELAKAVTREADARPQGASFWQAVSDCIAQQLAVSEGAPPAD